MDDDVRVYLAPHEYDTYREHSDRRTELAARIIGETSSRIGKTADLRRGDFYVPDDPQVELAFVRLRETKDSTEGENALGGKTRVSWVPWDLYEAVEQYCDDEGIGDDDELFDITADWLGKQIKKAAEATAIATGIDDYRHVRSHDFRAYYATNMVRRLGVDTEVVMEMGGWDSRKAIEPYLASPLPRDLQDELARAGVLQKDVPVPPRQDELSEILIRLEQIERALDLDRIVDVKTLTASDVQTLKKKAEDTDDPADSKDREQLKSLNDYLHSVTPSGVVVLTAMMAGNQLLARLRVERRSVDACHTAPSPETSAVAYTFGLLLVFGPLIALTGGVLSPDIAATAFGGVVGALGFNFEVPE
jgi:hypothetical protein